MTSANPPEAQGDGRSIKPPPPLPLPSDTAGNVFALLFSAAVYLAVWIILTYIVCFVGNFFHLFISEKWQVVLPLKTIDSGII